MAVCARSGAGLLVVPNASPYERGKDDVRLALCVRRAREARAALAYANMVGGQDELVFDGDSILVAADGTLLARGPQFEEALVVADLDLQAAPPGQEPGDQPVAAGDGSVITIKRVALPSEPQALPTSGPVVAGPETTEGTFWPRLSDPAEVYAALVTGVRDYVRDGFRSAILALSGGIDSALTATIAADAIGPRQRPRSTDAEPVLLGSFGHRRGGPGPAAGPARADDPDRLDGGRVRLGTLPRRLPEVGFRPRTCRPGCAGSS